MVNFGGAIDFIVALSWLAEIEKILDEGIQCDDEGKARIASFLLEGDAKNWWINEKALRDYT